MRDIDYEIMLFLIDVKKYVIFYQNSFYIKKIAVLLYRFMFHV